MAAESRIHVPEGGLAGTSADESIPPALRDRIARILIPESVIETRVRGLAERICQDYREAKRLTVLIVLDGALVFAADLARQIHRAGGPEIDFDFIKTRTYGDEVKALGETGREVRLLMEPREQAGKHVLIAEDIVDQGFTLTKVQEWLAVRQPASLRTCALLSKRLRAPTENVLRIREMLRVDYVGFEVPDCWVAGYGIDVRGDFRELPFVVAINESYYVSGPRHA